ncbi:GNAT family N-acetyltransferase [Rhodococcoides fascians]|uniref:GNAT family N-acetyltransferase n=1 Tax=Rhodococcoides fascians TaxID=1828 RepID=UPI00055B3D91|nr:MULTISPECIES: GNAT family N-acetyltransferase [Rhodococcus]
MKVRPRRETDLVECAQMLSEVHRSDGYPDRWPDDPNAWLLPDADGLIAEHDGCIVGHVCLVDREGTLWVSRLMVRPGARGLGVGAGLLEVARARGTLMLDVIESSAHAIDLYERTGWTLIEARPADWIMVDGTRPTERIYTSHRGSEIE